MVRWQKQTGTSCTTPHDRPTWRNTCEATSGSERCVSGRPSCTRTGASDGAATTASMAPTKRRKKMTRGAREVRRITALGSVACLDPRANHTALQTSLLLHPPIPSHLRPCRRRAHSTIQQVTTSMRVGWHCQLVRLRQHHHPLLLLLLHPPTQTNHSHHHLQTPLQPSPVPRCATNNLQSLLAATKWT